MRTEFIMLALRSKGINFEKYKKLFDEDFKVINKRAIQELTNNGYA